MFRSIDVSTSGLVAQRQRMNTIAGNIANVNTTQGPDGRPSPFQRRLVTFQAEESLSSRDSGAAGVTTEVEIDKKTPPRKVFQPGHPDADKDGMVAYPDINMVTEFVNAMDASRAFEANIAALELAKDMTLSSLRILS
jgi:flagellar basal-body rod protein FlgC